MQYREWVIAVALAALGIGSAAAGGCRIELLPAVPVTFRDLRPMVSAKINGRTARFIIDTGAFWSMLTPQARSEYGLSDDDPGMRLRLNGFNGSIKAYVTSVRVFTFLNVPFHNAEFLVGGNDFQSGAVGLLGGTVLHLADVEYNFGDGQMRFVIAKHCGRTPLAYWAHGQSVGVLKLRPIRARRPFLIGHARLDGRRIRVLFDSGSPRSMLALRAARRVGISVSAPGARAAGPFTGVGRRWKRSWVVPVAQFQIGDEKIERTRVLLSNFRLPGLRIDMVLGADFFLSHRIIISKRHHMMYFTYNGGPIFDLGHRYLIERGGGAPVQAGPGVPMSSHRGVAPAPGEDAAQTASRSMRRGMALAAEGQYRRALVDLNRACALEPQNVHYRLRRGRVYWAHGQPALALKDFDAAIRARTNFYSAHLARAQLLLSWGHAPADARRVATADINIASLLAPDASIQRLQVADLYARIGRYSDALRAIDLWIYYHRRDALLPFGWNTRCWIRAEGNLQLHRALRDCERAVGRLPQNAGVFANRALVYLRLGELRRAIASDDQALRMQPQLAAALYGRGLAELRAQQVAIGRADLTAATKIDPDVTRLFAHMHLMPPPIQ
ncbi:MAG: aspartyl protease family protein [Steroidobacteraceae bacterium]